MNDSREHWNGVYAHRTVTDVSWFEPTADRSMALIAAAGLAADAPIVDVGAGASVLVDELVYAGFADVTVLDVAADALAVSRDRLGGEARRVDWVVADLLTWQPARRYQLWHDRAVFHFLTERADRDRYRAVLRGALAPGGWVVLGTFADDGPTRCSGLATSRYSPEELAGQFPGFEVVHAARDRHHTPSGGVQSFSWVLLAHQP